MDKHTSMNMTAAIVRASPRTPAAATPTKPAVLMPLDSVAVEVEVAEELVLVPVVGRLLVMLGTDAVVLKGVVVV